MNTISNNSKKLKTIKLTPEEIINWLESHRALIIEIWNNNPELRKRWEELNL